MTQEEDTQEFLAHYGVKGMRWGKITAARDAKRVPVVRRNPNPTSKEIYEARRQEPKAASDLAKAGQRFKEDYPDRKSISEGRTEALKILREKEANYNELQRVSNIMSEGEKIFNSFLSKDPQMDQLTNAYATAIPRKPEISRFR